MKQVNDVQEKKLALKKKTIAKLDVEKITYLNALRNNHQTPSVWLTCDTQSGDDVCNTVSN